MGFDHNGGTSVTCLTTVRNFRLGQKLSVLEVQRVPKLFHGSAAYETVPVLAQEQGFSFQGCNGHVAWAMCSSAVEEAMVPKQLP